jgi:2-succinyl-5-enolpyruvyl-6-hydroxy-3-cyclohexene-1-carboxylate synthase
VVVHNDGGRMFEQLPVANLRGMDAAAMDHWITPHGRSFEHAARLYNLSYDRVETQEALQTALLKAHRNAGCAVIEAVVPPHGAGEVQRKLQRRVDLELEALR